jgi:hypothetical protein
VTGLPTTLPKGWDEKRLIPKTATIQARAEEILGALPADKTYAVVAVADFAGARLAAMVKLKSGWSFSGYLEREWLTGKMEGGAELRFAA